MNKRKTGISERIVWCKEGGINTHKSSHAKKRNHFVPNPKCMEFVLQIVRVSRSNRERDRRQSNNFENRRSNKIHPSGVWQSVCLFCVSCFCCCCLFLFCFFFTTKRSAYHSSIPHIFCQPASHSGPHSGHSAAPFSEPLPVKTSSHTSQTAAFWLKTNASRAQTLRSARNADAGAGAVRPGPTATAAVLRQRSPSWPNSTAAAAVGRAAAEMAAFGDAVGGPERLGERLIWEDQRTV